MMMNWAQEEEQRQVIRHQDITHIIGPNTTLSVCVCSLTSRKQGQMATQHTLQKQPG